MTEKKSNSTQEKNSVKERVFYFLIIYPVNENDKSNISFISLKDKPECIYMEQKNRNQNEKPVNIMIFKYKLKGKKTTINIKYSLKNETFEILFDVKESSFIFDLVLRKKGGASSKSKVKQDVIDYYEKMTYFIKALEKKNENEKFEILFLDAVNLYSQKPSFDFLIRLFIKFYDDKNFEFCSKLLDKFSKLINNENNMKRNPNLKEFIGFFKILSENIEKTISENSDKFNPIFIYGLILCYLNYYDYDKFTNLVDSLYEKGKNKTEKVLFDILILFHAHFKNPLKCEETLFVEFIKYSAEKTYKEFDEGVLFYLKDIFFYLKMMELNKDVIISIKDFKPLEIPNTISYTKQENTKEILDKLDSIINFSKDKQKLLIHFSNDFWHKLSEFLDDLTQENIEFLSKLRELNGKYNNLVKEIYGNKKSCKIKKEAESYEEKDEYGYLLDEKIKKYIKTENISNEEIIDLIMKYDVYYTDDKFKNKRDIEILEGINLDDIDEDESFIENFRSYNFELIFENFIGNYLLLFCNKIKKISDFEIIMKLINEKNIKSNLHYLNLLIQKYDSIIYKTISSLKNEDLDRAIKITANLAEFIYINQNSLDFISTKLDKIDSKIKPRIYIELVKLCKEETHQKMKEFVLQKFLDNLNIESINDFIELIDNLEEKEINDFMDKKMISYIINEDDFYSEGENMKIELLSELSKKGKFNNEESFYKKSFEILSKIYDNIELKEISTKKLSKFLKNSQDIIEKRLKLLLLILNKTGDPKDMYEKLKGMQKKIKDDIDNLLYIKQNLEIFHKEYHKKEIKTISETVNKIQNGKISEYYLNQDNVIGIQNLLSRFKEKADKINSVKTLKFFKRLFDEAPGSDQEEEFNNAYNQLKSLESFNESENSEKKSNNPSDRKLLNRLRESFIGTDKQSEEQIDALAEFCNKRDDNDGKKEMAMILKSKNYEDDIKSIVSFFKNFENDNEEWNEFLSEKYLKLSSQDYEELRTNLDELKKKKIYNYQNPEIYIKLFKTLYNKKEAIDFLMTKSTDDAKLLYDRLEPNDRTLNVKDITDTIDCVGFINGLCQLKDNFKIFESIKKNADADIIKKFENFSRVFPSIIDLYQNFDTSINLYNEINEILTDACFIFSQNNEYFSYTINKDKNPETKSITVDKLKYLKNKIHIKDNAKSDNNTAEDPNLEHKKEILLCFRQEVGNMEVIYEYMTRLRTRGSSLPINITIKIKSVNVEYSLDKNKLKFEDIRKYLFDAYNDLIKQTETFYRENVYLRFIEGRQFDSIMKHLQGGYQIESFLRYILNISNNNIKIKEGDHENPRTTKDYYKKYHLFTKESFLNISSYLTSLFKNNGTSIEKHYRKMLLRKSNENNIENSCDAFEELKGLYYYESESESLADDIVQIFLDKTGNLPIAQNILITNNETSYEEMEAFFHRAILCRFNTLFIVSINNSFSDYQQSSMNFLIDRILTYRNKQKHSDEIIDKNNTSEYLDSCIVFIYDNNISNETFINEIKKMNPKQFPKIRTPHTLNDSINSSISYSNAEFENKQKKISLYDNTHVYKSSICGLGKSTLIKNQIEKDNKEYVYIPLSGKLTRDTIFMNLYKKLNSIKTKSNYSDVAVHLDLFETDDKSILNEYLFSFLITKFYKNNENYIYIPKNIEIYIEIPNCFKDFMSDFDILKAFKIETITLKNKPPLKLSENIINHFKNMLGLGTNEEIQKFIDKYIPTEEFKEYSYHQANIFIKLFISQYKKFNCKLKFIEVYKDKKEIDVTEKCIKAFAECTRYFTLGGYTKLLTGKLNTIKTNNDPKDYKDLLSEIYENDLKNDYLIPLIFTIKEKMKFVYIDISKEGLEKKYDTTIRYLQALHYILSLKTPVSGEKNHKTKNKEINGKEEKKNDGILDENGKDFEKENKNNNEDEEYFKEEDKNNDENKTNYEKEKEKNKKDDVENEDNNKGENDKNSAEENGEKKEKESNTKKKLTLLDIITEDEYVITHDNFRKMLLILYRIIADIPVILMGETGCGKTALILMLNKLLNNGEKTLKVLNIHPGITDIYLCKEMDKYNQEAKNDETKTLWIFFDELNTCNSLALLTEIFINRTYNGKTINQNIRIMGACNPYRKKKENMEKCGLSYPGDEQELVYLVNVLPQSLMYYVFNFGSIDDEDEKKYIASIIKTNLFTKNKEEELNEKDTDLITKCKENDDDLQVRTRNVISECHKFLRKYFDPSVVSLREMKRFSKISKFLMEYYEKKNKFKNFNEEKKLIVIKSIINSIYICYYIRLVDDSKRTLFDNELRNYFIELVNNKEKDKTDIVKKGLSDEIDEPLKSYVKNQITSKSESFNQFSDLLLQEEKFLLEEIKLGEGIGINKALRENILLLFIAINTNIPLVIIGKPGSGKSLSVILIYKSMRNKYSDSEFFQKFPSIIQTYFQGSESTNPEDVESLFEIASGKLQLLRDKGVKQKDLPRSMIFFDELGLAERSTTNPLKVLHSKLDYDGTSDGVSFIGISNWALDASKNNRTLYSSVPNLDELVEDIEDTSTSIAKSINESLETNDIFTDVLPESYFEYKNTIKLIKKFIVYKEYIVFEVKKVLQKIEKDELIKIFGNEINIEEITYDSYIKIKEKLSKFLQQKPKELPKWLEYNFSPIQKEKNFKKLYEKDTTINIDFHGSRDFFYLIKGVAREISKIKNKDTSAAEIVEKNIERNFGGVDIEANIDFNMVFDDITENLEKLKKLFINLNVNNKSSKKKISSVSLFKAIYNSYCEKEEFKNYQIKDISIPYDLNNCINGNINDINSRYLLLEIRSSLTPLIKENIIKQNPDKTIEFFEGSPFPEDNNNEYKFKMINKVQDIGGTDKILILKNLNQIYAFLYDWFNMNFTIKDGKKYARVCQGNFTDQLTFVNDSFRFIIIVDKNYVKSMTPPFLNRFEKMIVTFGKLLTSDEQKKLSNDIISELNFKDLIEAKKKNYDINYQIKDLLINCDKEDIQGLIYFLFNNPDNNEKLDKDTISEKIYKKLANVLPQDIIINLNDNHPIKQKYEANKSIYNLTDYINFLNTDEKYNYNISIIYTFNNITNRIEGEGIDESMSFKIISEIRSENQLKNSIDGIISKNKNKNLILIHFDHSNTQKISFIINFIKNNYKDGKNKFLLIVHVLRNFNSKKTDKIYTVPDVDSKVNQIFIDNLNGQNKIKLNDLLQKNISEILDKDENLLLDDEFDKTLKIYVNKNLKIFIGEVQGINYDNYKKALEDYFLGNNSFKKAIISKAKSFINIKGNDLLEQIFKNKFISKNSIDIISIIIDYIKEKIFNVYLTKILILLEDNNLLTTLLKINRCQTELIPEEVIEDIRNEYLKSISINDDDDKTYSPKFILDFNIPGFYKFYVSLSDFISNKIARDYAYNEKFLRELYKCDIIEGKNNFDMKESSLLSLVYEEMQKDKFINNFIANIDLDLLLNDYITFYLIKYNKEPYKINYSNDDKFHKIINLLVKLRFNKELNIIKNNQNNALKIVILKIIWIESNVSNIFSIFKIYENLHYNFPNNECLLFDLMEESINTENLKYITNEDRNPEHTKEVNECFYIVLASICVGITSPKIKLIIDDRTPYEKDKYYIEINSYFSSLKQVIKTIEFLSDKLLLFLNEMYIIDELIQIYETFKINNKIEADKIKDIDEIITNLRSNASIIRSDSDEKSDELIDLFGCLYDSLKKIFNNEDKNYYELLRYIFYKEIKKVLDENYRATIFDNIIKENELIINSNNILKLLLKKQIIPKKDKFLNTIAYLLFDDKDANIELMENILKYKNEDNHFTLSETLMYFFEENSHIYLNNYFNSIKIKKTDKFLLELEPLKIFNECLIFLNKYLDNKYKSNNKNLCKLFCLGYIRTFLYSFISMIEQSVYKFLDHKPIIQAINGDNDQKNSPLNKMIKLYTYKIIFNKINKDPKKFTSPENIKLYHLDEYNDFCSTFIKIQDKESINFEFISIQDKEDYEKLNKLFDKYKLKSFQQINIKDKNISKGIDNFYLSSCNSILSNLSKSGFVKEATYSNFYKNVCKPLFEDHPKLFTVIQFLYNPEKYEEIKKKYEIDNKLLPILLHSYRYCLNELSSESENSIYSSLYSKNKNENLLKKYYPGNDITPRPILEIYSKIVNHFKNKSETEGCYVCLCSNMYYHSIAEGYPTKNDENKKCPYCKEPIGAEQSGIIGKLTGVNPINRDKYYRIFKDENEKKQKDNNSMNTMTLNEFEEKHIIPIFKKEKGICQNIEINHFKNDTKVVRKISQVSYRLLNFILYSHLFFAKIYKDSITSHKKSDKSDKFDNFLPKTMTWKEVLSECWELLKKELSKENITDIDIFMSYIFNDIFKIINKSETISKYEELLKIEEELEKVIQDQLKKYNENRKKYYLIIDSDKNDINSPFNLLTEKCQKSNYDEENYPFYEYLYYADYINEEYIEEKLKHENPSNYPVLRKYIENYKSNKKSILENLNMFNTVLNLFKENYSLQITREYAYEKNVKDEQLYSSNKNLIDEFIDFINKLNKNKIQLSPDSKLADFLIDDSTDIGKIYKEIYGEFANEQNKELKDLLDDKIKDNIFDINCKDSIPIQEVKENEIFLLNLPNRNSFIEALFNSSYRKIIITNDYHAYNDYQVNYEVFEDYLTEKILKNKKLLNNEINNFIYKNEDFMFENKDVISKFNRQYVTEDINIDDKVIIYKFYDNNKNNIITWQKIINRFNYLFLFLNSSKTVKVKDKIYNLFENFDGEVEKEFRELFDNKDSFEVKKTEKIFEYFLKLIFVEIKNEMKKYQIELNEKEIKLLDSYFNDEENHIIKNKILSRAIRLFITLFLFQEKHKEIKIKGNRSNFVNYLDMLDLWDKKIYSNEKFKDELSKIRELDIHINQVVYLYEYLGGDIEDDFEKEVIFKIKFDEETKKQESIPNYEELDKKKQEQVKKQDEEKEEEEEEEEEEEDDHFKKKDYDDNDDRF